VSDAQLISVVVPVYNEGENIVRCLQGIMTALGEESYEVLVVYDFEEDTTLAAVKSMGDLGPRIRLVRNDIGRGVVNALRAGFQAAHGDVVVTTMADLSDPPDVIPRMSAKIRAGADVVSGSRYMAGGSQSGAPLFKSFLSRAAGVSLHYLAGLNTHDATTNFRAYSRRFLDTVQIESDGGFEVALELTVKAHVRGWTLDEVPSSWIERSAGESQFRLRKWLPKYLKWYGMAIKDAALRRGRQRASLAQH
jgi:dolichol-phosphate mannosyltransferase